jgi:hypothetical protein
VLLYTPFYVEFAPGKYASAYRAFKMASCRPSQIAVTVDSVDEFAAGRIKVHIKQVKETGVAKASSGGKTLNTAAPDNTRTDRKLPEEKKVRHVSHTSLRGSHYPMMYQAAEHD